MLEGAMEPKTIATRAAALGFPAIALADRNGLYAAMPFSDACAAKGVQPIIGAMLAVARPAEIAGGELFDWLVLLAKDEMGYANLCKLVSSAHLDRPLSEEPHVALSALEGASDGLIALTAGSEGALARLIADGQIAKARLYLDRLQLLFPGRLYIELSRRGDAIEQAAEPALVELAYARSLPLVATNPAAYTDPSFHAAHDAMLCIAQSAYLESADRVSSSSEAWLKDGAAMATLFADIPEAIANTAVIAQRCAVAAPQRQPILPRLSDDEDETLRRDAHAGLVERMRGRAADGQEAYQKRLDFELDVITGMGFAGYFLIVADFIKWAKGEGIPVGPGRGSGAGSLVAWALTITDLDPIPLNLLFERFLNPERVSMPDFDIDFCQDRRDEVIKYVQKKYGEDRVAQIITHGKLQARAVLRDVGRVLQMPYGQVDKLCKMVPNNPANPVTLRQAIDGEPKLQEAAKEEPVVQRLLEISEKLEGLYRHASTHAAGMVIGDRPLDELVPLYRDPKSNFPITQFNWKLVEAAGLVKFDFLGLKTLTVLQKAVELIEKGRGEKLDLPTIEIAGDDPKIKGAYELLAKADTVGVFQLESTGMRESLKRLKPDRFEDIIAMVALYRPGPMDNIPTYINRKHGDEPIEYPHAMIEPILKETYGVIIYQEQVIQIAQVMGGYSLGQADLLRRAMGKKDKNEMAAQKERFVEGAMGKGVRQADATYIFELVDKFAGYGFNKSHAAAYALVAYHTAYLKANYRPEFLAASMTLDLSNTDKLAMFATEARRSGIEVFPPCVNASDVEFGATPPKGEYGAGAKSAPEAQPKKGAIRYALAALKNIGASAVQTIIAARDADGPFKDLSDFASRFDPKALNKRALETLAMSGAFDALDKNRALVVGNIENMVALAQRLAANKVAGTSDLFGGGGAQKIDLRPLKSWTPMERLGHEFSGVGFYLSGHPLDEYGGVLPKLGVQRFVDFEAKAGLTTTGGRLAAIVVSARERRSAKGNKFAFAMFSDATAQFEAVIFSDTLNRCGALLEAGTAVLLSVEAERDGETVKLRVQGMERLDTAAANVQRGLRVVLDPHAVGTPKGRMDEIKALLKAGGKGEVRFAMEVAGVPNVPGIRAIEFALPGRYELGPQQRGEIATVPGVLEVVEI